MSKDVKNILNEILLRMKYDLSKTLSENKEVLMEQSKKVISNPAGYYYLTDGNLSFSMSNPAGGVPLDFYIKKNGLKKDASNNYSVPISMSKDQQKKLYGEYLSKPMTFQQATSPKVNKPTEKPKTQIILKGVNKIKNAYLISMLPWLNLFIDKTIPKLKIIFPSSNAELAGVTATRFAGYRIIICTSLADFTEACNFLKENNIKVDELVLGTHGGVGGKALFGLKGHDNDDKIYAPIVVDNLNKILTSTSLLFLTACSGADYLAPMKDLAEKINITVYGSAGIYTPIVNISEKGFYSCSPNSTKSSSDIEYYSNHHEGAEYYFEVPENLLSETEKEDGFDFNKNIEIVFDKSIFGQEYKINKEVEVVSYGGNAELGLNQYRFYVNFYTLSGDLQRKMIDRGISKGMDNVIKLIKDDVDSHRIFVNYDGVDLNGKRKEPKSIDRSNEFLLSKGFCKFLGNESPITWLDDM